MPSKFTYPPARKEEVIDLYHGTPVPDPYRWMEDPDDAELAAWVDAQNTLTSEYLAEIPQRDPINRRLTALYNFPKYTPPEQKAGRLFYTYNDGLQNQPVTFVQDVPEAVARVLLDPNTLSEDGTASLSGQVFSKDGTLVAYGVSVGGSDWQEVRVRSVESGADLPDVLRWCKFAGIAWKADNSGFYYNRFPEPAKGEVDTATTLNNKVYWHTIGTAQSEDVLIYERPDEPELNFFARLSDDEHYLVLNVWHGAINRNRIYYRPTNQDGEFIRLIDTPDAEYDFIGSDGDTFFLKTNLDAPRGRIIAIDLANPAREHWRTLVPENDDVMIAVRIVNHELIVITLRNAFYGISRYALDGTFLKAIHLPGMGTLGGLTGEADQAELFIDFQSYLYPPTIFRYDFATETLTPWREVSMDFDPTEYETTQMWYPSKDGTQVSLFLTYRKGMMADGNNPTLLYGYGGFSAAVTPMFAPQILNWIQHGGLYAVANLRGGSEYGEAWHQAGMLGNKQNVFDDFIAAGEWLIAQQYTQPKRLAIMGRSNGGLLVAAVMLQRPELFGAVICVVPVADMLRYHRFTAGRYWTYEYGNAEADPEHFRFLYAYSPLHNIKPGVTYPPTLITTADRDDRVVPMHAKKLAAALQAADTGENPLLLRLDTRSGHGLGKPTSKWIDEWTDIHAFLFHVFGMETA